MLVCWAFQLLMFKMCCFPLIMHVTPPFLCRLQSHSWRVQPRYVWGSCPPSSIHSVYFWKTAKRKKEGGFVVILLLLFVGLFCISHKGFGVLLRCVLLHWYHKHTFAAKWELGGRKQGAHQGKPVSRPFSTNEFWQTEVMGEGALRETIYICS